MKILQTKKEAFDNSMPPEIKTFMQQSSGGYGRSNNAVATRDFDPSRATWDKITALPVSQIRGFIKSNEYAVFVVIDGRAIRVEYDPSNTSTSLRLTGTAYNVVKYKEFSLTKLLRIADDVYATKINSDVKDLRNQRYNDRKGIISRPGQAQDPTYRSNFDGEDWKQDASGYWYDANRLAHKLADLEVEDSAAVVTKAADIFRNMVGFYTDHIKKLANADDIFNVDSALRDFTYKGQHILSDASDKIRAIKHLAEIAVKTLDDINSQRDIKGSQRLSQQDYDDNIEGVKDDLKRRLLQLRSLNRQLNDEINK